MAFCLLCSATHTSLLNLLSGTASRPLSRGHAGVTVTCLAPGGKEAASPSFTRHSTGLSANKSQGINLTGLLGCSLQSGKRLTQKIPWISGRFALREHCSSPAKPGKNLQSVSTARLFCFLFPGTETQFETDC